MRIAHSKPLFAWDCLEDSPLLKTIRELLAAIPDGKLLDSLRSARGKGRNDYLLGDREALSPQRGIRAKLRKVEEPELEHVPIDRSAPHAEKSASGRSPTGSPSTWAMLIQRVYEVDPLKCAKCGEFVDRERAIELGYLKPTTPRRGPMSPELVAAHQAEGKEAEGD